MPDATESTVTVDGVEPSISVLLLDVPENPGVVTLRADDEGGNRVLKKGGPAAKLTSSDLASLGAFAVEVVEENDETVEPAQEVTEPEPAPKPAGVVPPAFNPPGQSGQ